MFGRFPSLKGFDFGLDRPRASGGNPVHSFPSLKGFDFGLDIRCKRFDRQEYFRFPSLKGFDFGLDREQAKLIYALPIGFHPSKGSTSA